MEVIEEFCPAKVNLFLAVTGRRPDGFHELVSLMAPITLGDRLRLGWQEGEGVSFHCDNAALPRDETNLVLRAVAAFRARHSFRKGLRIELEKEIPVGAGLGGGSSDAAGLLLGLNRLLGNPLSQEDLQTVAASIGSDCPFFLRGRAAVARGRGESLEDLPGEALARLRGTRLFLMKPSFPVSTAWAYGALARSPEKYCPAAHAEERLSGWLKGGQPVRDLLYNNLEGPVFGKFISLPALKSRLAGTGLPVLMSGSGSTLFAVLEDAGERNEEGGGEAAREMAREALGDAGWMTEVDLA